MNIEINCTYTKLGLLLLILFKKKQYSRDITL